MLREEGRELCPRNQVYPVIEIHVTRARNDQQLFRLRREFVSFFTELARMRGLASDKKHGPRRNRLDVRERVEVHELHVAA